MLSGRTLLSSSKTPFPPVLYKLLNALLAHTATSQLCQACRSATFAVLFDLNPI